MEPVQHSTPNHTHAAVDVDASIAALHTRTAIRNTLTRETWAILSAERSHLDHRANAARTARLWADLVELGYEPVRVDGTYDGVREVSYLVPGMGKLQAHSMGRMYDQESVLIPAGLLYCADGSLHPSQGIEWKAFGQHGPVSGDGSRIVLEDGSVMAFSMVLDFSQKLAA